MRWWHDRVGVVIGEGCRGVHSLWRLLAKVHPSSENSARVTPYIRSYPRAFTRPHFSIPLYHVRSPLPALLFAPNTALYNRDYYTIIL